MCFLFLNVYRFSFSATIRVLSKVLHVGAFSRNFFNSALLYHIIMFACSLLVRTCSFTTKKKQKALGSLMRSRSLSRSSETSHHFTSFASYNAANYVNKDDLDLAHFPTTFICASICPKFAGEYLEEGGLSSPEIC